MWSQGSWRSTDLQGPQGELSLLVVKVRVRVSVDLPKVPEDQADPGLLCLL